MVADRDGGVLISTLPGAIDMKPGSDHAFLEFNLQLLTNSQQF